MMGDNMDFKASRLDPRVYGMDMIHLSLWGMGLYLSIPEATRLRDILTEALEGNN